ncbi:MAG: tRNA (adenosine(37)-N6)-threonylcarbamoyltransferase complex transferase subunit TsaD [Clostridia bacterium]|nr:tRNA (adenosine(37)-N6)-threonylcarbamoyltransferase complex transferase subunit TsaD [Clostridia bacterium]
MSYYESALRKAQALCQKGHARILAVESSCDETAIAIVEDGRRVLANEIASQVDTHALYGGVVPEIASRMHVEALDPLLDRALDKSGLTLKDIDAVAVTFGPGLVGALLTGVSWGKALAYAMGAPLIGVNHIEGHVSANFVAHPELEPPFVCLVASGGHSHIVRVDRYGEYTMIGKTVDDAAGEAFDKVARVLNIPYPGGPLLDKMSEEADENAYKFPRAHTPGKYDFSFSGLKTAVINQAHTLRQKGEEIRSADWAASFRKAVVDALVDKTMLACRDTGAKTVALAGGVASNRKLRREIQRRGGEAGLRVFMPPASLCTDNAVMIASAAFYRLMKGEIAELTLNAQPSVRLIEN